MTLTDDAGSTEVLSQLLRLSAALASVTTVQGLPIALLPVLVDVLSPDLACYYERELNKQSYKLRHGYPAEFWNGSDVRKRLEKRPSKGWKLGEAVRTKELVVVSDPKAEERESNYYPVDSRVQFEVLVPLLAREHLVGGENVVAVVVLGWFTSQVSEQTVALLRAAAPMISSTLNNLLSAERDSKSIAFLKTITPVNGKSGDEVYSRYLQALAELLPTKFLCLWLYDVENSALVLRAYYPDHLNDKKVSFESFDRTMLPADRSLTGDVVRSGIPRIVRRADGEESFRNKRFAEEYKLKWFVSLPVLTAEGERLGAINVWPALDPSEFDDESLSLYQDYVTYAAHTIRASTLLFEDSLLNSFDVFLRELLCFEDDSRSWDSIARLVAERVGCRDCSVFMAGPDGVLRLKGTTGIVGNPPYDQVSYQSGEGLTGYAYQAGKAFVYYPEHYAPHHGRHISKFRERPAKSNSILFAPIHDAKGDPIGIVRCVNKLETPARRLGRFMQEDVTAINLICDLMSGIYAKLGVVREQEIQRDRSWKALHHELVGPADAMLAHVGWIEKYLPECIPGSSRAQRLATKCEDIRQVVRVLENVVLMMGPMDGPLVGEIGPYKLRKVVTACASFLFNEGRRLKIRIVIDPLDVPSVMVSPLDFSRVVYNLLRNALKYSDGLGPDPYVRVWASASANGQVHLYFEDNGIGVPKGENEQIFERYKRGSNASARAPVGEGLGLYYSRRIVELHGGKLVLKNNSKPTIFEIILDSVDYSHDHGTLRR